MQAKSEQADIGQVYPKDNLLALEAEIFSLLAQESLEKIETFSKLIQTMENEFEDVPSEEAYQAGSAAREQGISYMQGYLALISRLTQLPEVKKRYQERQKLFSEISFIEKVKAPLAAFINGLREHNQSDRLEKSYAQGYQECLIIRHEDFENISTVLEGICNEIERVAIGTLGQSYYEGFAHKAAKLKQSISSVFDEEQFDLFSECDKKLNERMYLAEKYYFSRGIQIAIIQPHGTVPKCLDSEPVDFEALFDYATLNRLYFEKTAEVPREDIKTICERIGEKIWDEFAQNKRDMSENLRCTLLLLGYLLTSRWMETVCLGFQANSHFSNKLIAAVTSYMQKYEE